MLREKGEIQKIPLFETSVPFEIKNAHKIQVWLYKLTNYQNFNNTKNIETSNGKILEFFYGNLLKDNLKVLESLVYYSLKYLQMKISFMN